MAAMDQTSVQDHIEAGILVTVGTFFPAVFVVTELRILSKNMSISITKCFEPKANKTSNTGM